MLALIAFVLILPLGRKVILLSFCALFLAVSYPFTKRFFALPQAYLGVAFGFGIPMAYAAQLGAVPLIGWVLLLANIFWTIAYDTEYAMVDRADDLQARHQDLGDPVRPLRCRRCHAVPRRIFWRSCAGWAGD